MVTAIPPVVERRGLSSSVITVLRTVAAFIRTGCIGLPAIGLLTGVGIVPLSRMWKICLAVWIVSLLLFRPLRLGLLRHDQH